MVKLRSIVFYPNKERGRWQQGPRCLRCSKLRRIGGLGGLVMTPRRSSGCGVCIPELTTRRHRERIILQQVVQSLIPHNYLQHIRWCTQHTIFEYRLYYARGRIIVIVLRSCQALHPSTGLCYVEGYMPLISVFCLLRSSEDYFLASLFPSFLLV